MADRIRLQTSGRVPAPPARRYVFYLLGLAMVVALWITFTRGGGPGDRMLEGVEERERKPRLPAERPESPTQPRNRPDPGPRVALEPIPSPLDPAPPTRPEPDPTAPAVEIKLPEGLSVGLARQLALNVPALSSGRLAAEGAFRELPSLVAATPPERRAEVLALVLEHVAAAARRGLYRREAFDAALALGATGDGAKDLVEVAARKGLDDDASAAAALLFLTVQPGTGGPAAVAKIDALLLDPFRPLHLRILAARLRPRDDRPQALLKLAEAEGTPAALRDALR